MIRRLVLLVLLLAAGPGAGVAQAPPAYAVRPAGADRALPLEARRDRGFVAVPARSLEPLGWAVEGGESGATLTGPDGTVVEITEGTPWFLWDGELLQLTDAPYRDVAGLMVPVQLLVDFLPVRLPHRVRFDPATGVVEGVAPEGSPGEAATGLSGSATVPPDPPAPGSRVVVIDAGHGGRDRGAVGRNGVREKDLALGVAQALAEELGRDPRYDVRLTRDRDVLVPLWQRGSLATEWKGERPGVFLSIHANAHPSSRAARGFETYFLAEARTEHARRVAEMENAPLALEGEGAGAAGDDLGFILRELRNLDTQHWSAHLADLVQDELATGHPGPDRGVKQGPFAVITNALMPAVLVEIGFVTHREEERLMATADFQRTTARSLARAVERFFGDYPPGTGTVSAERR